MTEKNDAPAAKQEFALTGKGESTTADITSLVRLPKLQMREGGTKEPRARMLAEAIKGGADLPRVKVVEVPEYPGGSEKNGPYRLVVDGHHTTWGYELLEKKMVPVTLWKGTWAEALVAAAKANKEHDTGGLPRTNEGKANAAKAFVAALAESETPKKQWPSGRRIAEIVGCSHTLVNEIIAGKNEVVKAKKKEVRVDEPAAAAKTNPNAPPVTYANHAEAKRIEAGEKPFSVVNKSTGQPVGRVWAEKGTPTHEQVKAVYPTLEPRDYVLKPAELVTSAAPPTTTVTKPTPAVVGFDWAAYDQSIGFVVRGLDGLGDLYDLKKTPEFAGANRVLNEFIAYFQDVRKKHGKKNGK